MPLHVIQAKVDHLWTKVRDSRTSPQAFRVYARRLMRVISEEGLSYVKPVEERRGLTITALLL